MHKYEIIDVIDEGAYGIVWKAYNKDTHSLGNHPLTQWQSKSSRKETRTSCPDAPSSAKSRCSKCSRATMWWA